MCGGETFFVAAAGWNRLVSVCFHGSLSLGIDLCHFVNWSPTTFASCVSCVVTFFFAASLGPALRSHATHAWRKGGRRSDFHAAGSLWLAFIDRFSESAARNLASISAENYTGLAVHYLNKNPGLDAVLSALARFRKTLSSGLVAPSRAFLEAPWEKWKKRYTVVACKPLTKHYISVHTIVYRMKTQKKRLTVNTCNFLHIANSLQIPVQNEHDAKFLRKHSTFAQFYMTTIWLYNKISPFYTKKCKFWPLRT